MAMTVNASIQLNDMMSSTIQHITSALNIMIDCMERTDAAVNTGFDSAKIYEMRQHIDTANAELAETAERLDKINNKANGAANATRDVESATKGVANASDGWLNKIAQIGAGYLSIRAVMEGIKTAVGLSDQVSQTTARLNLIVDDGGSVEELEARIRASAKRSRASYQTTADAVSKLGMLASDSFNSNIELIAFAELLNKSFVVAGTTATEMDAAMLQLTQAMAAGKLQGDEFRSIMENAPMVADAISEYMGVSKGELKELSSDGAITADIIKNSMISAADDINQQFEQMPVTWEQLWVGFVDDVKLAFKPLTNELDELAASENIQEMFDGISNVVAVAAAGLAWLTDKLDGFVGTVQENWDIIKPILTGIVAGWAAIKVATMVAATAQAIYNATLYACPIVWIIALIAIWIVAMYYLSEALGKYFGIAETGFGVICGVVNYLKQGFIYLGQDIANVFLGIWEVIKTLVRNIERAFKNSTMNIKATFYGLGSAIMNIIGQIAEKLNKLPFVEFDYSGIINKADEWAAKAAEEKGFRYTFASLEDAYNIGASTFNTRPIGWAEEAFKEGAAWGDGVSDKISGFFNFSTENENDPSKYFDEMEEFLDKYTGLDGLANDTDETAKNTKKIADNTDKTNNLIDLVKDNLEREAIMNYTSKAKTITYDLSGMQNTYNNTGQNYNPVKEVERYLKKKAAISTEGI